MGVLMLRCVWESTQGVECLLLTRGGEDSYIFFVNISTVNCDMNVLVPGKSIGRYMHDCIQLYM